MAKTLAFQRVSQTRQILTFAARKVHVYKSLANPKTKWKISNKPYPQSSEFYL